MKVGVALGSNLGDRLQNLHAARQAIAEIPGVTSPIVASSIYETEPVDCEPGASKFLNAVLEFDYSGGAFDLWRKFKQIEAQMGRPSLHERNVSRPIDLDLLYFGDLRINTAELVLPHPQMDQRRFVLEPLAEIDPDLVLPGQSKTVWELLASLPESAKVTRLIKDWRS
jgi:2-amino-4-hydroxy-6-hydroxymethyldihydropteridine diphosphokinase